MRPLIGLPCFATKRAGTLTPLYAIGQAYVHAIEDAGGVPVLLPALERPELVADLRGRLDGVLLPGGGDVEPVHYGERAIPETQPPDPGRDGLELALARQALDERLPVLGICRGIQLLNVVRGGTLVQDIRAQLPDGRKHDLGGRGRAIHQHSIEIKPGSRLSAILGELHHEVNSFHHQAVKRPGAGVEVVAWAADGVPEAMELADYPFALAVQFHPERSYQTDPAQARIFAEFVRACQVRAAQAAAHGARATVGAVG
ncbi:MAG TPA: gamma-glutamyl-gamma-aminobutyrate hydrolase family protein [Ktedonobacterales bacterium]|jgi:putative glutamine amidotransferase